MRSCSGSVGWFVGQARSKGWLGLGQGEGQDSAVEQFRRGDLQVGRTACFKGHRHVEGMHTDHIDWGVEMEEPNLERSCAGRVVVEEGAGGHECAERGHRPAGLRAGGGARPHPAPTTARTDARYDSYLESQAYPFSLGPRASASLCSSDFCLLCLFLYCLLHPLYPVSCRMPVFPRCAVGRARRAGGHFVVLVNDGDGQDEVWDMERRAREFNDKDKLDERAAMQVGTGMKGIGQEKGCKDAGGRGEKDRDRLRTRFTWELSDMNFPGVCVYVLVVGSSSRG